MLWLENLLSQATLERLGWTLVHFIWQAAVVAMLLAVFLRLLRKSSANLRYLAACSALLLMVVLPVATMQFIEVPGPAAEAGPLPTASSAIAPPTAIGVVEEMAPLSQAPDSPQNVNPATAIPWNERIASVLEPALPYVVLGWLTGVFGLSAWHLGGWMQLQRLKRRMVHGVGTTLQHRLVQIAHRLGVHRAVTLLESALVEVPTVVGWLRPVILLPASALTGLSPEQLEAILAHELAHIRRYDYLINVLQTIVEILGFYHPAVWWVSRRIRIERENCCDDMAVRVCGDSMRYVRALTCLEEIRHNGAELAIAATGGSLMERISRLLGRSATDDRRFAWLPGLVALLLVAAIVIPAALALAASASDQPVPLSADVAAPIREAQDMVQTNEPNRALFLLDFIFAEVFSDAILDQDAATRAVDLLASIPAGNARRTVAPALPSIEELQQPLVDVFARFAPTPGKSKNLVDLLVSKGYALVICNPRLEMFAGQQASIATRDAPDPNAAQDQNRKFTFMRLNVTANEVQDQNATLLNMDFTMTYPAYSAGDRDRNVDTSVITSLLVAPNDQYTSIIEKGNAQRMDKDGRMRLQLLLVKPTIVSKPSAASSGEAAANRAIADESETPATRLRTEAASEPNAAEADKAHVQVGIKIVKTVDSSELDRETVLRIERILGKRVRPEGRAGEFGPRFHLTIGEVLRNHVVQQPLPGETVDALLPLFRDVEVLAWPRITARDGEKCQMRMVSAERFYPVPPADGSSEPAKLEKVEAGTKVAVTPHVGDHNEVTMEIMVEMTDLLRPPVDTNVPVVQVRSAQATVTTRNNRYIAIAGMTGGEESVYIMAIANIVEAPAGGSDTIEASVGTEGMGGFGESSDEVNTRVFADPVANQQWIQLRMQYVTSDPMYQELARQVAEAERKLLMHGQKWTPDHPQMVQERALLDALKKRMDERKKSLEQEFEEQITRQSAAPANDKPQVHVEFLAADPVYQELAKQVVEMEQELMRDGQKFTPEHPQMVKKRALLDTLKRRMDERRKRLEQEFEEQMTK